MALDFRRRRTGASSSSSDAAAAARLLLPLNRFLLGAVAALLAACATYDYPQGARPKLPDPRVVLDGELGLLEGRLRKHIAGPLGKERNTACAPEGLQKAAEYLRDELNRLELDVRPGESIAVPDDYWRFRRACGKRGEGVGVAAPFRLENIEVTMAAAARENGVIVVGAHYDSALATPGANDNGSGSAAALELARLLRGVPLKRAVRIVFFFNEEEPFFVPDKPANEWMGSRLDAVAALARKEKVDLMISLETLGYYTGEERSQCLLPRFNHWEERDDSGPRHAGRLAGDTGLPVVDCAIDARTLLGMEYDKGDFLAIVGNLSSRRWVKKAVEAFRAAEPTFPVQGVAAPGRIFTHWTDGLSWSDQRSYWEQGYAAIMVTDTAPLRYPYYHWPDDTYEKVQYRYLARVVAGLARTIQAIAND